MKLSGIGVHLVVLGTLGLTLGCGSRTPTSEKITAEKAPKAVEKPLAVKRITDRPANPQGSVLILEYHKVAKGEARWDRSISKFKSDLERLYTMGFRPVTLSEYAENRMTLPPGASPVVLTFDDSHPSQFRYLENGDLDPETIIGIWAEFTKSHPDFPIRGTFFILPPVPFGQKASVQKKINALKVWGCEIGSHTMTHTALSKLSDQMVKGEIEGSLAFLKKLDVDAKSLALPYGISPKKADLLSPFKAVVLVGAGPAPSPESPNRNLKRIPRIQGIEGDYGITYWLDRVASQQVKVYVAP